MSLGPVSHVEVCFIPHAVLTRSETSVVGERGGLLYCVISDSLVSRGLGFCTGRYDLCP